MHFRALINTIQNDRNLLRTQFISSLIESWGSKTEQTQAQTGFQPI